MPIYEYRCENGHLFEVMQRITDDPVTQLRDLRGAGPAGLPPDRGALQGLGLLQHRLRHRQAQARAGQGGQGRRPTSTTPSSGEEVGDRRRSRLDSTDRRRPPRRRSPPPRSSATSVELARARADCVGGPLAVARRSAQFRDELRGLDRASQPPGPDARGRRGRLRAPARLAAQAQRARLGGAELARAVRRRRRDADRAGDLLRGDRARPRAADGQHARPHDGRPDRHRPRRPRTRRSATWRRSCPPRRSGARASPSRSRARTSPR